MAGTVIVRHTRQVDLEDSEEAAAAGELLPSDWNGDGAHEVVGAAPLDSPAFVNEPTAPTPPLGDTSTRLATMEALARGAVTRPTKILDGVGALASPYASLPTDEVLIVKQNIAAPFAINVDWSQRTNPLRVVDGKGDANINNITITPSAGQTQLTVVNLSYVINSIGGSVILTPLPDHTGAY